MRESKVVKKPKEVALYYGPDLLEDGLKTVSALTLQGLEVRRIEPNQLGQQVGFLAGLPGFETGDSAEPPLRLGLGVLVLSGLAGAQLDASLFALRQAGLSRPLLKSILTPTNRNWTFSKLCGELVQERDAIRKARAEAVKDRAKQ